MPITPSSIFDGSLPFWLRVVLLALAFGWSIWAFTRVDTHVYHLLARMGGSSWPRALLVGIAYPLVLGTVLGGPVVAVIRSQPLNPLMATVIPLLLIAVIGPFLWPVIPNRTNGPIRLARWLQRWASLDPTPAWTLAISSMSVGLLGFCALIVAAVTVMGMG